MEVTTYCNLPLIESCPSRPPPRAYKHRSTVRDALGPGSGSLAVRKPGSYPDSGEASLETFCVARLFSARHWFEMRHGRTSSVHKARFHGDRPWTCVWHPGAP